MITGLSHTTVWVLDQNSAKKFYTEKLGFDVRDDTVMTNEYMPGTSGFRWLTVGPKQQPDLRMLLAEPKPPMVDEEAAKAIRALVAKGALALVFWIPTIAERRTRICVRRACSSFRSRPTGRTALRRSSGTTQGTGTASPSGKGASAGRASAHALCRFLELLYHFADSVFRMAEKHRGLWVEVKVVVDAREARLHRALDDDDVLGLVDVEDRHAVDGRAGSRACRRVG